MKKLYYFILLLTFSSIPLFAQDWSQIIEQKVIHSDALAGTSSTSDEFSYSVSISGNIALIGALTDDVGISNSGSAYIFEKDASGTWQEVTKLTASDAASGDNFGYSVSIDGNRALIGAWNNNGGAAYIFEPNNNGEWVEVAKLNASDGVNRQFGQSVSISGSIALIGARLDDTNGSSSGSAYIFERNGNGEWLESSKLVASDGEANDDFGYSVALSGNTALIGSRYDDDQAANSGAAYIFEKIGNGSWQEVVKLTASDGAEDDWFGWSVSISGETALIGAYADDDNGSGSGSAYVFEKSSTGTWQEVAKLIASDGASFDKFGYSVSVSNNTALIGAYSDKEQGNDTGAAYTYVRNGSGAWLEAAKLTASDATANDWFGFSVAISESTALVGARLKPVIVEGNIVNSGSAYFISPNTITLTAPINFSAIAQSSSNVLLTWKDESDNETSFEIERSKSEAENTDGSFVTVDATFSVAANSEQFNDITVDAGTTYYYKIRAKKD